MYKDSSQQRVSRQNNCCRQWKFSSVLCNRHSWNPNARAKSLPVLRFINKNKETISLQMFDDVIQHLFTLYQEQNPDVYHKSFSDLTDDDIVEVLLTVKATTIFNEKRLLSQLKSYRYKHFLILSKCLSL